MNPCQGRRHSCFLCAARLIVGLLTVSASPAFSQDPPQECKHLKAEDGPRLATGLSDSSYLRFARQLKEINRESLDRWQVCSTQGSLENLGLLSQGKVEFAIVQGDLMHRGWLGEQPDDQQNTLGHIRFSNLALVRRLFSERLHIVAGPHTYASSIVDFKGKRVWLGPAGSGTYATATEVLRAAHVELNDDEQKRIRNYYDANDAMLRGKLDAFFRVTPVPVDRDREEDQSADVFRGSLTYLFRTGPEMRLLSMDQPLIDRILQGPAYVQVPIYRDSYPGQRDGIMTIGLEAMLITRVGSQSLDDVEVVKVNDAISSSRALIARRTNIDLDLLDARLDAVGSEADQRALASHVHPKATTVLLKDPRRVFYQTGAIAALTLLLAFFSFRSKRTLETLACNTKYLVTVGLLGTSCVLFGVVLWYDEGRFSSGFRDPLTAAWSLLVYFSRGLKTEAFMTQQGQLFALLALAVIATLVHSINSDALGQGVNTGTKRLSRWFFRLAARLRPDERQLIVLNWNERASEQIIEWMKDSTHAKSRITIVCPDTVGLPEATESARIDVLRGDPKSIPLLDKARVQDAQSVLVCSAWIRTDPFDRRRSMDTELADSYSIRAIQAIRLLERGNPSVSPVHIDAEIFLDSNRGDALCAGGVETNVLAPKRSGIPSGVDPLGVLAAPAALALQ